jgi:hypothetical protein
MSTSLQCYCFSVISRLEGDISDLSIELSDVQSSRDELSEAKVRLEIRCVDLEEQRDRVSDEAKELQVTIENLKSEIKVRIILLSVSLLFCQPLRRSKVHQPLNKLKKVQRLKGYTLVILTFSLSFIWYSFSTITQSALILSLSA